MGAKKKLRKRMIRHMLDATPEEVERIRAMLGQDPLPAPRRPPVVKAAGVPAPRETPAQKLSSPREPGFRSGGRPGAAPAP